MKKILTSAVIVVVGILTMSQAVFADSAVLSATPSYASNVAGSVFNVSIKLDPANNKVCVIKGVINFTNLSCQNITLASGIMAQTAPTCDNPSFTVGIPKCSVASTNLFSVSVKGTQAGQTGISFSGVKVIGAGNDVAFTSQSGVYDITAIPQVVIPTVKPAVVTPVKNGLVKPVITSSSTATTTVSSITEQTATSTASTTSKIANAAAAVLTMVTGSYAWSLLVLIIILSLGYGLYYFSKKDKDN